MSGTVELVGALRLPLGGVNGYSLLGKQGRTKDIVPRHDTAEVAANGTVTTSAVHMEDAFLPERVPEP